MLKFLSFTFLFVLNVHGTHAGAQGKHVPSGFERSFEPILHIAENLASNPLPENVFYAGKPLHFLGNSSLKSSPWKTAIKSEIETFQKHYAQNAMNVLVFQWLLDHTKGKDFKTDTKVCDDYVKGLIQSLSLADRSYLSLHIQDALKTFLGEKGRDRFFSKTYPNLRDYFFRKCAQAIAFLPTTLKELRLSDIDTPALSHDLKDSRNIFLNKLKKWTYDLPANLRKTAFKDNRNLKDDYVKNAQDVLIFGWLLDHVEGNAETNSKNCDSCINAIIANLRLTGRSYLSARIQLALLTFLQNKERDKLFATTYPTVRKYFEEKYNEAVNFSPNILGRLKFVDEKTGLSFGAESSRENFMQKLETWILDYSPKTIRYFAFAGRGENHHTVQKAIMASLLPYLVLPGRQSIYKLDTNGERTLSPQELHLLMRAFLTSMYLDASATQEVMANVAYERKHSPYGQFEWVTPDLSKDTSLNDVALKMQKAHKARTDENISLDSIKLKMHGGVLYLLWDYMRHVYKPSTHTFHTRFVNTLKNRYSDRDAIARLKAENRRRELSAADAEALARLEARAAWLNPVIDAFTSIIRNHFIPHNVGLFKGAVWVDD